MCINLLYNWVQAQNAYWNGEITRVDIEHHISMQDNRKKQWTGLQLEEVKKIRAVDPIGDPNGWDLSVLGGDDGPPLFFRHNRARSPNTAQSAAADRKYHQNDGKKEETGEAPFLQHFACRVDEHTGNAHTVRGENTRSGFL